MDNNGVGIPYPHTNGLVIGRLLFPERKTDRKKYAYKQLKSERRLQTSLYLRTEDVCFYRS